MQFVSKQKENKQKIKTDYRKGITDNKYANKLDTILKVGLYDNI